MSAVSDLERKRAKLADEHEFTPCASPAEMKVGISRNIRSGILPINGVRIEPTDGDTGWYIWAGEEMSEDPDFFVPLHVAHLNEWCPEVLPFLELPPGWRFLIAPGHEDVWFDVEVEISLERV